MMVEEKQTRCTSTCVLVRKLHGELCCDEALAHDEKLVVK